MSGLAERRETRVLVVHSSADLYGSDRVLWETVIALVEDGVEVVVVLPHPGPLSEKLRDSGATVRYARTLILQRSLMRPSALPRLLAETVRGALAGWRAIGKVRPDVILINTVAMPLWPLLARLRRVPSVSHVHEAERGMAPWVNRLIYLTHNLSQTLVVNSRFTRDVISEAHPRLASRAQVIYNGVAGPADVTPPAADSPSPLRLLFVGRLSPRKGADLVVEATAMIRDEGLDVRTTLLGAVFEGNEWFEAELHRRITDLGLLDNVALAGFHPSVWPFLNECDVLVVPSRLDESFGNTAVEGALAARPTIVSDSSGLREAAAGMSAATLVESESARAIADAALAIVAGWKAISTGAVADRATAQERYSPQRYRADIARVTRATAVGEPRTRVGDRASGR